VFGKNNATPERPITRIQFQGDVSRIALGAPAPNISRQIENEADSVGARNGTQAKITTSNVATRPTMGGVENLSFAARFRQKWFSVSAIP